MGNMLILKLLFYDIYLFFFSDRPLTDYPIFMKREIDLARQMIEKPEGSELVLLNKILNGATKANNGGLALDIKNLKQIMNDLGIDTIPELENMLVQEKKLLMEYLRKTRNSNRPATSMYMNDILGKLRKK